MESLRWRGPTLNPIRTKREGEREEEEESADGGRKAEQPLSPASIMFHQPGFNVYIIVVFGCQTSISVDVVKEKLKETLLKHPRFCSLQVTSQRNEIPSYSFDSPLSLAPLITWFKVAVF